MEDQTRRQIESLVADLIERQLSDERREQLNFLLRDSEACRSLFNSLMDVQADMTQLAGHSQELLAAILPASGNSDETLIAPNADRRRPDLRGSVRSRNSSLLPWFIAAASFAALLIVLVVVQNSPTSTEVAGPAERQKNQDIPSSPVVSSDVRLAQASGAEYFNDGPVSAGQEFVLHREYVLTSGKIMIAFPNGAEAVLESPSAFKVTKADRLFVTLGHCSVHAPEGAEGFQVDTPKSHVIDLGTRFSVNVSEVGVTDVHVIEGAAKVLANVSTKGTDGQLLTNGQARRFETDRDEDGEAIPFDRSSYVGDLPDRVLSYRVGGDSPVAGDLASLRVQRGGKPIEYQVEDLIGVRVISFVGVPGTINIATLTTDNRSVRELLENDKSLATGLINPGGSAIPLSQDPILTGESTTPGMGIQFVRPVINGPGPDLVLFELQKSVEAATGDGFHVCPLKFEAGLRSFTVKQFDLSTKSGDVLPTEVFNLLRFDTGKPLLDSLLSDPGQIRQSPLAHYALPVGIDLSDLGYAEGQAVDGLFLQDDASEERQFDPVFIGGFPEMRGE